MRTLKITTYFLKNVEVNIGNQWQPLETFHDFQKIVSKVIFTLFFFATCGLVENNLTIN